MVGGNLDEARASDTLDHMRADLREAYERGRRDERARRHRHPIGMTLTFAVAAVGVVILVLAALNGSFGRAGMVVDQSLSIAAPAAREAASSAGQSVRDAARSKVADAPG